MPSTSLERPSRDEVWLGGAPAANRSPAHVPEPYWAKIPHGLTFCGDANSVAVDSHDNVYVFNRGPVPVMVFDSAGNHLGGWGEGEFVRPHGAYITEDDAIWLVDTGGHFVQKRDLDGKILLTIGERGRAGRKFSGEPFNGPTDIAIDPATGDIFVADGYGNNHIHKYDAEGRHIKTWGGIGDRPGELTCPHGICLADAETLVVCDRENFRLQFFTLDGEFIEQWHSYMPSSIRTRHGSSDLYLAQLGPPVLFLNDVSTKLGNCIQVVSREGEILDRLAGPGEFVCPHGIAVDSQGDVYIAEVTRAYYDLMCISVPSGVEPVSLRKWRAGVDRG